MPPPPRQLGRIPSRYDHRTIRATAALHWDAPTPPTATDWHTRVPTWSLGGNDRFGNCVVVTAANMLLTWRANATLNATPVPDADIIATSTDLGALRGYQILDRLRWWRRAPLWHEQIWAYLSYEPAATTWHRRAIWAAGAADIGLALPTAWQSTDVWDTGSGPRYRPGTWGLHSVPLIGYDAECFYCATWGKLQPVTAAALTRYCDEAWWVVAPSWLRPDGTAPNQLDLARLCDALHHAETTPAPYQGTNNGPR